MIFNLVKSHKVDDFVKRHVRRGRLSCASWCTEKQVVTALAQQRRAGNVDSISIKIVLITIISMRVRQKNDAFRILLWNLQAIPTTA